MEIPQQDNFIGYEVSISLNGEDLYSFRGSSENMVGRTNLTEKGYASSKVFESYNYKIRGVDKFYSYSEWTAGLNGYGALTPEKFIKTFEAYALKPWEFINSEEFKNEHSDLVTKWGKSEIKTKIDAKGTGSLTTDNIFSSAIVFIYENTNYHNGRIGYASRQKDLKGDIRFKYENAGEMEGITANGEYNMTNVNSSGNNGSVSGVVTVTGMYPASVDFSSLSVQNYAFSGNYKGTMNYSGEEVAINVTATQNNF